VAPHALQNLAAGGLGERHVPQSRGKPAPHSLQNLAPSGCSLLQGRQRNIGTLTLRKTTETLDRCSIRLECQLDLCTPPDAEFYR
jgi:hypothetical protein